MLELGQATGDRESVLRGHAFRLWGLLELGDLAGVDAELALYARLADELRMPEHTWHTFAWRGMRMLMDGDLAEAERLAGEARRAGDRAEQPLAAQYSRDPADPDPQPPGPRRRAAAGRARAGRALPRHPGLAQRGDQSRGAVRRHRGGTAPARALRRRRPLRDPPRHQLVHGDQPAGRGRGAARRLGARRADPRRAAALRRPADRRGPCRRPATALWTASSDCCPPPAGAPRTRSATSSNSIEISRRSGDKPGLAISRVDLAEQLLARGFRGDRRAGAGAARRGSFRGARDGRAGNRRPGPAPAPRGAGALGRRRDDLDRRGRLGPRARAPRPPRPRRARRDRGDPLQRHRGLDADHRAARRRALAGGAARAQRDLPRASWTATTATR